MPLLRSSDPHDASNSRAGSSGERRGQQTRIHLDCALASPVAALKDHRRRVISHERTDVPLFSAILRRGWKRYEICNAAGRSRF